jgi:hypothetical protein
MLHEDFAERIAGRLEARADALGHERRRVELNPKEIRAEELRQAARLARDEAATVTQEEALPPEAQA